LRTTSRIAATRYSGCLLKEELHLRRKPLADFEMQDSCGGTPLQLLPE
jgi:hypothetical protein